MKRDLIKYELDTSFLAYEKDIEIILKKLFIENKPHSDILKQLLLISNPDCLTLTNDYLNLINSYSIKKLKDERYIHLKTQLPQEEFAKVKTNILIYLNNFTPSSNPQFRDCILNFDIITHNQCWDLDNYQIRPLKICGYIDGLLNNTKLTGIGKLIFLGCTRIELNENLSGYELSYVATHGSDDRIPGEEDE